MAAAENDASSSSRRLREVGLFVALAYLLSWWPWLLYRNDPTSVDAPILPIGPLIAAIMTAAVFAGLHGLKELFRKVAHWRVGPIWYAIVLLVPVVLTVTAVGLNIAAGAKVADGFVMPQWPQLIVRFLFIFFWIGLGEEPGWRGYLLPRLLVGRTAFAAAIVLGLIHAVWHWTLFGVEYDVDNVLPWAISVFCFSIVICWIWIKTGGSVLMAMLMHASNNTIAVLWRMFDGEDQIRLWWIWCALWVLVAAAVVARNGLDLGRDDASPISLT